jgi:predicted RNA-binding Zn ribbon-like protein
VPLTETEFVTLLNSAPVVDGSIVEMLDDVALRTVRDDLHRVIRAEASPAILNPYLEAVTSVPTIGAGSTAVSWALDGPAAKLPLAEVVLEWSRIQSELPGRLRPCGNPECNKFLLDHSKPNTARWCSMASCGNRMKARRYQSRQAERANG